MKDNVIVNPFLNVYDVNKEKIIKKYDKKSKRIEK